MSYIIHFSRKMLTFLSYITHLITGVFITEDPKMSSLHLKKKCIENISENLLVHFLDIRIYRLFPSDYKLSHFHNWILLSNMKPHFLLIFKQLLLLGYKKKLPNPNCRSSDKFHSLYKLTEDSKFLCHKIVELHQI